MHRHFTAAGSVLMFGGGASRDSFGKTADERPCKTIENPATITDIHATIFRAMGIPTDYHITTESGPSMPPRTAKAAR